MYRIKKVKAFDGKNHKPVIISQEFSTRLEANSWFIHNNVRRHKDYVFYISSTE